MTGAGPPDQVLAALARWSEPIEVGQRVARPGTTSWAWHVRCGNVPGVLKVVADRARFVTPGLEVAAELARRAVRTGPPIRTTDGAVAVEIEIDDRPATVCVLQFEPGDPVDTSTATGVQAAAHLLATVHTRGSEGPMPAVPNRLLDWFDGFLPAAHPARSALTRVLAAEGALSTGVVYGDPAPEVLLDEATSTSALIDWGTPSFGPLAYDVATWSNWLTRRGAAPSVQPLFLVSYEQLRPLTAAEHALLPSLRKLAAALPVE